MSPSPSWLDPGWAGPGHAHSPIWGWIGGKPCSPFPHSRIKTRPHPLPQHDWIRDGLCPLPFCRVRLELGHAPFHCLAGLEPGCPLPPLYSWMCLPWVPDQDYQTNLARGLMGCCPSELLGKKVGRHCSVTNTEQNVVP